MQGIICRSSHPFTRPLLLPRSLHLLCTSTSVTLTMHLGQWPLYSCMTYNKSTDESRSSQTLRPFPINSTLSPAYSSSSSSSSISGTTLLTASFPFTFFPPSSSSLELRRRPRNPCGTVGFLPPPVRPLVTGVSVLG